MIVVGLRSCQFHHDYTRVAPTDYTITRLHSKSSTDGLHGYTTTLWITLRITLEQLGDYSDYTVMVVTLRITLRVAPTDYSDYTTHPDYTPDYTKSSTGGLQ